MLRYSGPIIVIASLLVILPLGSSDLIYDICKTTPNPQLCASILRADPKGPSADVTGLALIMVDSIKSKSTSAVQIINQLLKSEPNLKAPLSDCLENYNTILKYLIAEAVEALTKGDPKFAEDATRSSASGANTCQNDFKPSPPPPLSDINTATHDVADIATSIIRHLL